MIDKKNKEVSFNNQQHVTTEELDKQTNNDKVQHDPSGLNLRTRTISSTSIPTTMHQTTISTAPSGAIPGRRPRGRPPRQKNSNLITKIKSSPQTTSKPVESAASSLERLQQQQNKINQCNGNHDQENSAENVDSKSFKSDKHSILLPDINKNKECAIIDDTCENKSNARKRKQFNVADVICKKRLLDSDTLNDSSVPKSNTTENCSLPSKSNAEAHYGFLTGYNYGDWHQQRGISYSFFYGHTYWPANWEYSGAVLTGHVPKKSSKDSLRKIRLLSSEGTTTKINSTLPPPLKSVSTLNKYHTSVVQRRGTACKLNQPSIDLSSSLKLNSSIPPVIARRPGRPPGKKNKLLQAVLKSNSPRKSPRQHASTLAAILSGKSLGSNDIAQQTGQTIDLGIESNKNSLDVDGPCILPMAVPKHEHKSGFRHYRHRRQLEHQQNIIKRRRRRRSITPPPPKLCAQQPAPQHISINESVVDQETVKLRTKHVDVVRRRARDERLRAAFVCQQLHKVQEIAEQNRRNLAEEDIKTHDIIEQNFSFLPLERSQNEIWSSLEFENDREPDNMCLQIMYEQTSDKKFLRANLTDDTLQMYHQHRELALAERLNNYNGDTVFSDFGTDMISAANKRKKKRPNMTGWPKEKRRKVIASSSSITTAIDTLNGDSDVERNEIMLKRRRAAAAKQQKLRRQRIKLEQLQLAVKEKAKDEEVSPALPKKRRGRRPGPLKKNKTTIYRRRKASLSSNVSTASSNTSNTNTEIKEKKLTVKKQRRKRLLLENKTTVPEPVPVSTVEPNTVVKRSCGRPRGSVGRRQRRKLKRHLKNQTSMSPEQQKENVVMPQTSTGKLKCVISTRNNRMKLLPSSSSSSSTSSSPKKTMSGNKSKKSAVAYNLSSCLESLSSPVTVVGKTTRTTAKKKRLQQQQLQQMATTTVTWDVGRPKRYHSANHGRNAGGVAVEEDCCFVGSQPFEQHCPGVGEGINHNTVLENQQYQKENTVHIADL